MSASPRHPQTTITSRFYNFARLTMFNHCKPMKTRQKIPLLQPVSHPHRFLYSPWGHIQCLTKAESPRCPSSTTKMLASSTSKLGGTSGPNQLIHSDEKKNCQTSAIPWSFCCGNFDNWELEPFQILLTSVPRFVGTQKANSVRFCLVVTFRNQKIDFDQNCLILKKHGIKDLLNIQICDPCWRPGRMCTTSSQKKGEN